MSITQVTSQTERTQVVRLKTSRLFYNTTNVAAFNSVSISKGRSAIMEEKDDGSEGGKHEDDRQLAAERTGA